MGDNSELYCEACKFQGNSKGFFTVHLKSNEHVKKAFEFLQSKIARQEYIDKINSLENEKKELTDKYNKIKNVINTNIDDFAKLQAENDSIKKDYDLLDTEHKTKTDEMTKEINTLKEQIAKQLADDSGSSVSDKSDTSPYAISNYSKKHETYRNLMERLFGVRPLVFVNKGHPHNSLFGLLRSSYQMNYNSWKICYEHITTYNMEPRITIGIPIINTEQDKLTPFIFYMKFHIYTDKETGYAVKLSGWDGVKEFDITYYK